MGSLLKLKKKQAMIFLENMSDFVFGSCNVTVSFDDTMSITKAKTIHKFFRLGNPLPLGGGMRAVFLSQP